MSVRCQIDPYERVEALGTYLAPWLQWWLSGICFMSAWLGNWYAVFLDLVQKVVSKPCSSPAEKLSEVSCDENSNRQNGARLLSKIRSSTLSYLGWKLCNSRQDDSTACEEEASCTCILLLWLIFQELSLHDITIAHCLMKRWTYHKKVISMSSLRNINQRCGNSWLTSNRANEVCSTFTSCNSVNVVTFIL